MNNLGLLNQANVTIHQTITNMLCQQELHRLETLQAILTFEPLSLTLSQANTLILHTRKSELQKNFNSCDNFLNSKKKLPKLPKQLSKENTKLYVLRKKT